MLWDGATQDTYSNILPVPDTVYSVQAYESGWIVFAGSSLYWTDGYSLKKLNNGEIPDSNGDYKTINGPYSMLVDGDTVYINTGVTYYTRAKKGLWIYDINNSHWTLAPFEDKNGKKIFYGVNVGSVLKIPNNSLNYNLIFVSYSDEESDYHLATFNRRASGINKGMALLSFNASRSMQIKEIELVLGQAMGAYNTATPNFKAIVAIADGNRLFWEYGLIKTTATAYDTITVDGTATDYNRAEVGDMIFMVQGGASGEYAFITDISGAGTATEVWTLDRNLTAYPETNDYFNIFPLKKMGEHTVNSDTFKNPYIFNKAREVDGDFYVMIIIDGTAGDIDIRNLAIY
jgi:hypothetical protein